MPTKVTPEMLARIGSETGEQKALFCWAAESASSIAALHNLFAIPNGGLRDKITAGRMKAEGARSGVPDMLLAWPRLTWNGLFIEMKVGKGRASEDQQQWHTRLRAAGYRVEICYSWQEARDVILQYLGRV